MFSAMFLKKGTGKFQILGKSSQSRTNLNKILEKFDNLLTKKVDYHTRARSDPDGGIERAGGGRVSVFFEPERGCFRQKA